MKSHLEKQNIEHLFNSIAPHYDFLNHFLSFGIDRYWRKRAIQTIPHLEHCTLLDVASGTGDFAIEAIKQGANNVVGIDISEEMLKIAVQKTDKKKLSDRLSFQKESCHHLSFSDQSFDVVTVAFGIRNVEHLEQSLREIYRVLKKNGTVVILEFAIPKNKFIAWIYTVYFFRWLPFVGGLISGEKKAYRYLPASVVEFPQGEDFLKLLRGNGFRNTKKIKLSSGIAYIYMAVR